MLWCISKKSLHQGRLSVITGIEFWFNGNVGTNSLQSSQILADMANRTHKTGNNYTMPGIEEDLLGTLGQAERGTRCQLTANLPGSGRRRRKLFHERVRLWAEEELTWTFSSVWSGGLSKEHRALEVVTAGEHLRARKSLS